MKDRNNKSVSYFDFSVVRAEDGTILYFGMGDLLDKLKSAGV